MKKTGIIIATIVALFLVGGLIIVWSAHQREEVEQRISTNLKDFSDENFEKEVVEASKSHPILVDFYAEWCFPCRMLEPILEEVAKDLKGRAIVGKVNTDKNLIGRKFGVSKIPALFIIRDGEIKNAFYGVVPKDTIIKALQEYGA
ncbi:MAG TPA: thioredoxin domain-containing protein [Desulfomonilaceae bacterium]|nr:thioredoxin domain-containing protein [Desulfomonilaceae bacterium]